MKKMYFFLLLSIISTTSFAQQRGWQRQGRLSISSVFNGNLRILIDGNTYNLGNGNDEIYLNNLSYGNHRIQIFRVRNRRGNNGQGGWTGGINGQSIYQSTILIKRGFHTDVLVNRFGRVFVDEQAMNAQYDDYTNDNPNGNNGGWNNSNNGSYYDPISYQTFEQLKLSMKREGFDANRISLAKQALASSSITTVQAKELALLISFEEGRLDLAKFMYTQCSDRQNYFMINDVFSFNSSKEELARYIRDNP